MAAIAGNQPSKSGSSLRAQRSPRWLGYGHNGYAWWKERRRERRRVSIIAYYHIGRKLKRLKSPCSANADDCEGRSDVRRRIRAHPRCEAAKELAKQSRA